MTSNNVQVKMRAAAANETRRASSPRVTKSGEIWRAYGAGSGPENAAGSCDLGPGNVSAHDFNAGDPCATPKDDGEDASAPSTWQNIRDGMRSYAEKHTHAVTYAAIGLVAAVLIIAVGLLPTLLIALLAAVGYAIGRYRDGDNTMKAVAHNFAAHFGK